MDQIPKLKTVNTSILVYQTGLHFVRRHWTPAGMQKLNKATASPLIHFFVVLTSLVKRNKNLTYAAVASALALTFLFFQSCTAALIASSASILQ